VCASELNTRKPLTTCRKRLDVTKTRADSRPWDQSGGSLFTGQMVTGIKAAGTRHRLW